MMKNKMKLTKYSGLRVAGALPLAAGMMLLFSFTSRPPEIIFTETTETVEAIAEAPPVVEPAREAVAPETVEPVAASPSVTSVPEPAVQEPQKTEDIPIYNAEVMPVPPGGDINAFRKWLQGELRYPKESLMEGIQGTVTVSFVVERDGSLSSFKVLASPDQLLTDEAIRVLGLSAKWTPGMQAGKPVRVFYTMPIVFNITEDKPADNFNMSTVKIVGYGAQRKGEDTALQSPTNVPVVYLDGNRMEGRPMIILDGKEITDDEMKALDPNTIRQIDVLKDASAKERHGERGKDGAILITSKKKGDTGDAVTISADKDTPMGVITDLKQRLREVGVSKVTYTLSNGESVTADIK